jgi:hypothetical protein
MMNQFIPLAVAEKVAKLEHEEWVARRRELNAERIAAALAVLDKPSENVPGEDDRLPEGYRSARERYARVQGSKARGLMRAAFWARHG